MSPSAERSSGSVRGRGLLLVCVWTLVAVRVAAELTGRGAGYWHSDLAQLYGDQTSFYHGIYPHAAVAPGETARLTAYPPFSFPLFLPWLPPGLGWRGAQVWFTFCQILATAVVVGFAWRRGREAGRGLGWLLAGGVLAMTGLRADLLFGNCAVLMTATLVWLHAETERPRPAGIAAAFVASMMKPQMGWLFGLLLFRPRLGRVVWAVTGALVLSTLAACAWTGVSPWRIVQSHFTGDLLAFVTDDDRHSLAVGLRSAGLSATWALAVAALAGVACTIGALRTRLAAADTLTRFAFVSLVNRICTYHNACDDLLLVFPLIWLGRSAWRDDKWAAWMAFLLLGATVWAPTFALHWPGSNSVVVTIWVAVAAWLWWKGRSSP